jgi:hypothetical protein
VREFNSKPGAQLFINGWALASARQQQAMDASSLVVEVQGGADVRQDASNWRKGKTRWVAVAVPPVEAVSNCRRTLAIVAVIAGSSLHVTCSAMFRLSC